MDPIIAYLTLATLAGVGMVIAIAMKLNKSREADVKESTIASDETSSCAEAPPANLAPVNDPPTTAAPTATPTAHPIRPTVMFSQCFKEVENGRAVDPTVAELEKYGVFPLPIYVRLRDYHGVKVLVPQIAQRDDQGNIFVITLDGEHRAKKNAPVLAEEYLDKNPDKNIWEKLGIIIL